MGITAEKKKPRGCHPFTASCTSPCLGSGAPDGSLLIMLRKYPLERHLLLSDCSCGSKELAGIVHVQIPASTAEEKQQTSCAWMQGSSFSTPITGKGASCLPFLWLCLSPSHTHTMLCLQTDSLSLAGIYAPSLKAGKHSGNAPLDMSLGFTFLC